MVDVRVVAERAEQHADGVRGAVIHGDAGDLEPRAAADVNGVEPGGVAVARVASVALDETSVEQLQVRLQPVMDAERAFLVVADPLVGEGLGRDPLIS